MKLFKEFRKAFINKHGCNLPRKLTENQNVFEMPQEKHPANKLKN